MRAVFHDPEALRPGRTSAAVTQDAARQFAEIAAAMRARGLDPAAVAHFLDRLVFCLFAEDTGLLPDMVFSRIVKKSAGDPARFGKLLGQLFDTMATGGDFGLEPIRHFNGNLFDDRTVLDLTADDVKRIAAAAPSIGAPLTPPSSAPCSSAASTPPSARNSGRTSPAGKTSNSWSTPWSWPRCAGSGTRPGDHRTPADHRPEDARRRRRWPRPRNPR
jgi:hypothetical protein